MIRRATIAIAVALCCVAAFAQSDVYMPYAPLPVGTSYVNIPTPHLLAPRTWELRFTHRFSEPINKGDAHSLWGLDSASDVGFGASWAASRDLELSLFRTNVQDDIELAAKYRVIEQAESVPLSITGRAGADWRTERNVHDRVSGFAQLLFARQFARRIEIFAAPTYVNNADPFQNAFNIPIGAAFFLKPTLSAVVELVPENRDLPEGTQSDFGWTVALKRAIGGHFFEIVLSDTRATTVDQYATTAFLGGLRARDVHLGFNIERRFGGSN